MTAFTSAALILALAGPIVPPSAAVSAAWLQRGATPEAAALKDFQDRLAAYLELRSALAGKLKPLTETSRGEELAARQQALAAALRKARRAARPGDLIPVPARAIIADLVAADLRRRNASTEKATLAEVPDKPRPAINRTYPDEEALATVPPLLLSTLPRLPDNLQYRYYGRHLVILDADVQIILDYVANVLPSH